MPGKSSKKRDLDDIQVLGVWNFTIQAETPLVWLRTGALDRYLLRFSITSDSPSTAGLIFHAEADGPGLDGVSFWVERRPGQDGGEGTRRYVLAGNGLESQPLVTKKYPDLGGELSEEVEVLVQGFSTVIFVRNRQVQIRCRTKLSRGSMCFFNSTKATEDGLGEDVHFSNCRITALRRGPLEVAGTLMRREMALQEEQMPQIEPSAGESIVFDEEAAEKKGDGRPESVATTALPDSPNNSTRLMKAAATTAGTFYSPGTTKGGFRNTTGSYGKQGQPSQSHGNSMFTGRSGLGSTRMKSSLSDSSLRKSGSALCGLSPAKQARAFHGDEWVPLAKNLPKTNMKLLREHAIKPLPASRQERGCHDFIQPNIHPASNIA